MQKRPRGLRELCRLSGHSRQAYYQYRKVETKRVLEEDLVIQQVLHHRKLQPRTGTRKLHELLQPFMDAHGFYLGRDLLFDVLRANHLLIVNRKAKPRTTFSAHLLKKYPDLAKGLIVNRPNALWVSDITYIRLFRDEFAYLSLVTDAYSRKIVGFHLSENLSADSCLLALQMALADNAPAKDGLIHHSDRGAQYCSHVYTGLLLSHHIGISMTQGGDPRDNAIAERVNGILKQELLQERYPDMHSACQGVEQAIDIYNRLRLHSSIDMLTPEQAHQRTGEISRRWKSYYEKAAKELAVI
jgi:transposase InsO family protein